MRNNLRFSGWVIRTAAIAGLVAASTASFAHFLYLQPGMSAGQALAAFADTGVDDSLPLLAERHKEIQWRNLSSVSVQGGGLNMRVVDSKLPFGADWEYGVLDRKDQGRGVFRLRYFAKGVESFSGAGKKLGQPVEVTVSGQGGSYVATVWKDGKPAMGADLALIAESEAGTPYKTGPDGKVTLPHTASLPLTLRAMVSEKKAGELAGKAYPEMRSYATLVIGNRFADAKAPSPKADPVAYRFLRSAINQRVKIPAESVVSGSVTYQTGVESKTSKFTFSLAEGVNFPGDTALSKGQQGDLDSLFMHRKDSDFDGGDGGEALTLGAENVGGVEIQLNDDSKSTYWVKDGQIRQVNRVMGPMRLTIDIIENSVTNDGRYLPKFFVVYMIDKEGKIITSTSFVDRYVPVNGVWLPAERKMVSTGNGETKTTIITFSDLKVGSEKD